MGDLRACVTTLSVVVVSLLAGCTLIAPLGGLSDALEGEGGADASTADDAAPSNDGAPQDALLEPDQVVIGSGEDGGGGPGPEGGPPKDAGCTVLCSCNNGGDCPKGVCANSLTVGSALFSAAGNDFCTLACCTSDDCPAGTVCYASGQGGQYCVAPSWVGRSAPGSALGGTACSSDSACRSGLCAAGRCADTCCSLASSSSQCGGGTICAFGAFPGRTFDTHFAPHCQPQIGSLGFGASCSNSSQCRGGLCYQSGGGGNCTNPCEGSGECGPGNGCQIDQQGSDLYFACFPTPGSIMEGQACTSDQQCAGYWCGSTNECTDVCLRNADCTVAGWYCRTEPDTGPNGTYDVLVCGP